MDKLFSIIFFHIASIVLSVTIVLMLFQYSSSQPLSTSDRENDNNGDNSIWIRPSLDSESNYIDVENADSNPKYLLVHTKHNRLNEPNSLELVRRANFWRKRANFW
jgi:hypothetical protein